MQRVKPDNPMLRLGHPLADRLVFAWAAAPWDYYDLGSGQTGVTEGTTKPNWTGGQEGGCNFVTASAGQIKFLRSPSIEKLTQCSVTVRFVTRTQPSASNYGDLLRKENAYNLEACGSSVGNGYDFSMKDGVSNYASFAIIPYTAVSVGVVHTLTFSLDGTASRGNRYIDGVLYNTGSGAAFTVGNTNTSTNNLYIGNYGTSTQSGSLTRYFDGWIDQILIHARNLSAGEAEEIHADPYVWLVPARTILDVATVVGPCKLAGPGGLAGPYAHLAGNM